MAEDGPKYAISIVLFVFFGLLLYIVSREITKRTQLPVCALLLSFGILLRIVSSKLQYLDESVALITEIDQDIIGYSMLPLLLFRSSFSVNWHMMKQGFVQILTLSTSALILNIFLLVCSFKFLLGYEFDMRNLIILGSMLSSVDSIALDNLLQEMYAPDALESLIAGESVVNGSIILALFDVLLDNSDNISSVGNKAVLFSRLFLGGLASGLIFSYVMGKFVKRMINDYVQESNSCIVTVYLLFWMCNYSAINFSEGIAVLGFGIYLSAYANTILSPRVHDKLKNLVDLLSKNIESVAFLIAGVLLSDTLIYQENLLTSFDYGVLFLVFPLTYVTRIVSLLFHYPILKHSGYGMNWREFLTLSFSSIKGVILTTISLIVFQTSFINDVHFRNLVIYLGIGTTGLSILFGSFALKILVKYTGLENLNEIQENMLIGVVDALVVSSEKKQDELFREKDLNLVNWTEVLEIAGPTPLIRNVVEKLKFAKSLVKDHYSIEAKELLKVFKDAFPTNRAALKIEMRRRYLHTLRGIYIDRYEKGLCHDDTSLVLIDSCNGCLDQETLPINDWKTVKKGIYPKIIIGLYTKLSKCPVIGVIFRKALYKKIILAYDSSHNFIICHNLTEEILDQMEIDIDKTVFEEILEEANAQVDLCERFLNIYIVDLYPEVLAEVQTKRASKAILHFQEKLIEEIFENGLIKEVEHNNLKEVIDTSIRILTFQGFPSLPILREILISRFAAADTSEINFLISKIEEKKFNPGDVIFTEGEHADGAYYIIRGRVNEKSSWVDQELIIGNIVGVQHLLPEFSETNLSTATAISLTIVARIPKEIISMDGFTADIFKEASEEMMLLNRPKFELGEIEEKYIIRLAGASSVLRCRKGKQIAFTSGGVAFRGKVYEKLKGFVIRPKTKLRDIIEDSIVMTFPQDFPDYFRQDSKLSTAIVEYFSRNKTISKKDTLVEDLSDSNSRINDSTFILTTESPKKEFKVKKSSIVPYLE